MNIIYNLLSPGRFYNYSGKWVIVFAFVSGICLTLGVVSGLLFTPPDYIQGDAYRIIYLHVPSAILSLGIYIYISILALLVLVWRIKVAAILLKTSVPLGALFTFIALITGSLWGKPMWGTWWIWDARLTSELILFFIYMGIATLQVASKEINVDNHFIPIFVLFGLIDIPIIHFSVIWWNTLHQGMTFTLSSAPKIDFSMVYPLFLMLISFISFFICLSVFRARYLLLFYEKRTKWVQDIFKSKKVGYE